MELNTKIAASMMFALLGSMCSVKGYQVWQETTSTHANEQMAFYGDAVVHVNDQLQSMKPPTLEVQHHRIRLHETFSPMDIVTAYDEIDGDLQANIRVYGEVHTDVAGDYILRYVVENSYGLKTQKSIHVLVDDGGGI